GEHRIAPSLGPHRAPEWRVRVGRADQPREQRGLADREIGELLPEVELGGLADAEDTLGAALTEVDLVQVALEDLLFGVATLGDDRHRELAELPPIRPLLAQEEVLHELLGERTAAFHDAARD